MPLSQGEGASPQVYVPKVRWFAAVVDSQDPTGFSFVGCTVFPGFDFSKFTHANSEELTLQFPQYAEAIQRFTPS